MPELADMPDIEIAQEHLLRFGTEWVERDGRLPRTPPNSSGQLGVLFDEAVGNALSTFLGGIPIERPNANSLLPPISNCVEVGTFRVVGGVRPQNFDVGYRPDGVRFAFDSKTLNDRDSVGKNYQNMINDLATEATTVHLRFPYALVAFMVVIPEPCLEEPQRSTLIETLERMTGRDVTEGENHIAEAIALVVWDPNTGNISADVPDANSPLRLAHFSRTVQVTYENRYKGLPPHTA